MKKIVLAYSGGLDTSYCLKKFTNDGFKVHAVSVNTGGFTKKELNKIKENAYKLGAVNYVSINSINNFYEKIIKFMVFGNVLRNNVYPLSVSSERIIQAIEIVKYAKKNNCDFIAHGSTGAGNDQVRFDMIFQILAPEIKILTPIRDNNISREDELNYLKENKINLNWNKAKYSINKGLWGTSIGGDETLTSNKKLPEEAYPTKLKNKKSKKLTIEFKNGEIDGLNGKKIDKIKAIEKISEICDSYCIGRDIHVGDTIMGIKGRVGFQAGGPQLIIKAHHLLEKHTLTKWQLFQKDRISDFYGMLLHEGQYLDPVMRDIEAFLFSSQSKVSGSVISTLFPYRFELDGIVSDNDLMNSNFGLYGEKNKLWDSNDAKGFIKILSSQNKIYQNVNEKNNN